MEFEEMKQIWCAQDEEPLYDFNVEALHESIKTKKESSVRKNNFNDFGLIAVLLIVAILWIFTIIINSTPDIYGYLIVAVNLLNIGFLWVWRLRRKKKERAFGRTMLDDLDHAIHSVTYEMDRTKIMRWTFVLPSVILIFLSMWQDDASFWGWIAVAVVFVLAVLGGRWEYTRCRKPRKQKLEVLREKLTERTEAMPL